MDHNIQGYALSPAQCLVWDMLPHMQRVFIFASAELRGPVDPARLESSVREMVQRHSALQMQMKPHASLRYPLQELQPAAALLFVHKDLSLEKASAQQQMLDSLKEEWERSPVPVPGEGAGIQVMLLRLTGDKALCWWKIHPLLLDAAGVQLLLQETAKHYNNTPLPPAEDLVPYENYARWQLDMLEEPDKEAVEYWSGYKDYYFDRPLVPYEQKKTGALADIVRQRIPLDAPLPEACRLAAVQHDVSLRTLLLSLFVEYLQAFDKPDHWVIGVTRFERAYEELRQTAGLMTKTLPLLVDAGGRDEDGHYFRLLQQQEEALLNWEDYFTGAAAGRPSGERIAYGFTYIPAEAYQPEGTQTVFALKDIFTITAPHVLQMVCQEREEGLVIDFYYDREIYDAAAAAAITGGWQRFLHRKLSLQPTVEPQAVTAGRQEWGSRILPLTVLDLFRERVALHPEHTAVVYNEKQLTYEQLDLRSNALARLLKEQYHIGATDRVALLLPRSEWLLVCILGVLKTGAAYIPIDAAYPDHRILQILESGDCKMVLSEPQIWEQKGAMCDLPVVLLEDALLTGVSTIPPAGAPGLQQLAYIIFTSGSTGKPKGVMVAHDSLTNYIQWCRSYYFRQEERCNWGLFTAIAFDLTVTSIFTAVCSGQTLYIGDQDKPIHTLLAEFAGEDSTLPVDILKLTPSHVAMLKNLGITKTNVKKMILGGEALEWDHIQILKRLSPEMDIYNEYGPTEATVGCVIQQVEPEDGRILIGEPVANTSICILDEQLQPVETGCTGELYIGGRCLAKGYFQQPALTGERFVLLPWDRQQQRWYKTGDVVRQHLNGKFEYLGRADNQIKIRGYRIEPGEIQAAAMELPGVQQALAAMLTHGQEKQLVLCLQATPALKEEAVLQHLSLRLPVYMVPSQVVVVETFPLTPNGKADEKALLKRAQEERDRRERPYVAPVNLLETKLQQLWEELLGVSPMSTTAEFFLSGGNSLSFSQLILRINQQLHVKPDFRQFFKYTTIRQQAQLLEQLQQSGAEKQIMPLPPQDDYAVSPAQYSIWKACQIPSASIAYHMPGVMQLEGKLDIAALQHAWRTVIARHEILHTVFRHNTAGELRQYIVPALAAEATIVTEDKRHLDEASLRQQVLDEIRSPFHFEKGPLLRAKLWQTGPADYRFIYTMHHIISDGWSMHVFFHELIQAYEACTTGKTPAFLPLAIQYKDYAAWLQELLNSEEGLQMEQYWRSQFDHTIPELQLATDFPRPAQKSFEGKTLTVNFEDNTVKALSDLTEKQGGTLFISLQVLVHTLLYKYTGQQDIVIGSPIAGRSSLALESQIGLYMNTLALRNTCTAEQTVAAFYDSVKDNTLQAYAAQVYPFEYLLEKLALPLNAGRSPLFDVMVVLQNIPYKDSALQQHGLRISNVASDLESSKYDLCFFFIADGGQIRLHLEYDTALFREETVQALLDNLQQLALQLPGDGRLHELQLAASTLELEEEDAFLARMNQM